MPALSLVTVLVLMQAPPPQVLAPVRGVETPTVAVVASSKKPGADAVAQKVAAQAESALKVAGFPAVLGLAESGRQLKGKADPRSCAAAVTCLQKTAATFGTDAVVVGVDITRIVKSVAIHLEAVSATGESLAVLDLAAPGDGWEPKLRAPLADFAAAVKAKTVPPPPPVAELPPSEPAREVTLTPEVRSPPPEVVEPPKAHLPRAVPLVVAGGALVAGGVSLAMGLLSLQDASSYRAALYTTPEGAQASRLSLGEAERLAGSANARATAALISGIVAAVLAVTAGVLFALP